MGNRSSFEKNNDITCINGVVFINMNKPHVQQGTAGQYDVLLLFLFYDIVGKRVTRFLILEDKLIR